MPKTAENEAFCLTEIIMTSLTDSEPEVREIKSSIYTGGVLRVSCLSLWNALLL